MESSSQPCSDPQFIGPGAVRLLCQAPSCLGIQKRLRVKPYTTSRLCRFTTITHHSAYKLRIYAGHLATFQALKLSLAKYTSPEVPKYMALSGNTEARGCQHAETSQRDRALTGLDAFDHGQMVSLL